MNKNGWGLRKELAFIVMFLVCLLMAAYGLNTLGLVDKNASSKYRSLENKLTEAALDYYNDKYTSNGDTVIIKYSTLYNNGYIGKLKDSNGHECSGYTKITSSRSGVSYINCFTYKTEGYSKSYE